VPQVLEGSEFPDTMVDTLVDGAATPQAECIV
jgi:hypothetical protein